MKKLLFLLACACLLILIAVRVYNKENCIKQTVTENFNMSEDVEKKYMSAVSKDSTDDILIPYKLITQYDTHVFVDYGTFNEIDSLKCIRYKEMVTVKAKWEQWEREAIAGLEKRKTNLEYLNKPCK